MSRRFRELLRTNQILYGVICRDTTVTDLELMAQVGYSVIFLDLEHSPQSTSEVLRLGRTISHLGMVPLVRIPELTRSNVQCLLDGGIEILTLPDVKNASQASRLVQLAKFPPLGNRGVSTSSAGINYTLGANPKQALQDANEETFLMAMIESNQGCEALDTILKVQGIDLVTVGEMDWSVSLGLFGVEAKHVLAPKIEKVLTKAQRSGKILAMGGYSPTSCSLPPARGPAFFCGCGR